MNAYATTGRDLADALGSVKRSLEEGWGQGDRQDISFRRPYRISQDVPVYVVKYIGSGRMTCGYYANADLAKERCPNVGRWIKRGDDWHSEDGRTVIGPNPPATMPDPT